MITKVVKNKNEALREVQNNIDRGLAQGADPQEIVQWEHTYTDVLMDRMPYDTCSALAEQRTLLSVSGATDEGGTV